MKSKIPILFSEKVLLAASAYNLKADPFVGLIEAYLNRGIDLDQLNLAYQKTIQIHTSFNIFFKKSDESLNFAFEKEKLPPSSSDIKVFRDKKSFLLWKKTPLSDPPLQDMAVYKNFFHKTLVFKFHHLILDGRSLFYFFKDLSQNYDELKSLSEKKLPFFKTRNKKRDTEPESSDLQLHPTQLNKFDKHSFQSPQSNKSSLKNSHLEKENKFKTYQKVMEDFALEEKRNRNKKINFWKEQLMDFQKANHTLKSEISAKTFAGAKITNSERMMNSVEMKGHTEQNPPEASQANSQPYTDRVFQEPAFHIRLSQFQLKKLTQAQLNTGVKIPYLLFSLYSKSLQETFQIDDLILRTAFSARHNLTDPEKKRLIASLSRSAPLFIKEKNLSITDQALSLEKQVYQLRKYLILDKFPLDFNELKSYSKLKSQSLSLSMSYFFYKKENFLGYIKSFSWQSFFLDLVLFVILSEKTFLLSFSYNPNKFSKKDLKNLSKVFSKQIKSL